MGAKMDAFLVIRLCLDPICPIIDIWKYFKRNHLGLSYLAYEKKFVIISYSVL